VLGTVVGVGGIYYLVDQHNKSHDQPSKIPLQCVFGTLAGGNLQSYWTTTKLWKLTVVLYYHEAMENYSRIGLLHNYGKLQWLFLFP
jgi:hypothetical protein